MNLKIVALLSLITIVASLGPAVQAQTFSVIHTFTGSGGDGAIPQAGVTLRGGALFGTTYQGGAFGGSVYQLTHVVSNWTYTAIFLFANGDNGLGGYSPFARVVFGPDGHLYGTTSEGGMANGGVLFDLVPPRSICGDARCTLWKENIFHYFGDRNHGDGWSPGYGDLIWDQQGNLYGTTLGGGLPDGAAGVVFQLNPGTHAYSVIHTFATNNGSGTYPQTGVTFGPNGDLFGTTELGGLWNNGTVFELRNSNQWEQFDIEDFGDSFTEGAAPIAGLVRDSSGNLYGATSGGGASGGGTVFELFPFTVLYSLQTAGCPYAPGPHASLTVDTAGNLYGTTYCGGANDMGTVFKLTKTGDTWTYTSLHDFTGGADGAHPVSNVSIDSDGTLYGTAGNGGNSSCNPPNGCGVVWMIKP